jgi:hypothetical protein
MLIRKIKKEDINVCGTILKNIYSLPPYNENFLN